LPLASCDDDISREAILRRGIALAGGADDTIVSFGDASWDVRAAANLGLPFIGIGRRSGAPEAFDDFTSLMRMTEDFHHRDTKGTESSL
jgi:hypothetical protein